ncbi:unnamed protein product [Soboliphyme baturini]|uniref:Guanine nucleotide-binding protein-like 3 homolog n=1 Tax=Soboliphyme baturini TaxID=241478 RepID=A0A183IXG1_9BILA|nr:unnamed protein product [Soboliphyme baturini]
MEDEDEPPADLVPADNVHAWLSYLRKELPTVAFKASTQQQNSNLGRAGHAMVSTRKSIGADLLLNVLGNYCRNRGIKTVIRVGIVGYPNVGKSSIINSLKRSLACVVGAVPGVTRTAQEVHLSKKIRLIDTPGVVFATKGCFDKAELALKNAFRVEKLEDPVFPVGAVLRRCTKDKLMLHYRIAEFKDLNEFLSLVARKIGKLRKGGVPDIEAAARIVLLDWNNGRIRYHSLPPETFEGASYINSEIVAEMSKEFNLDDLSDGQSLVIKQVFPWMTSLFTDYYSSRCAFVNYADVRHYSDGPQCSEFVCESIMKGDDGDVGQEWYYVPEDCAPKFTGSSISLRSETDVEQMELDVVPDLVEVEAATPKETASSPSDELTSLFQTEGNQRIGHDMKLARKKLKKKKARVGKLADKLSERMEAAVSLSTEPAYNFETDFT